MAKLTEFSSPAGIGRDALLAFIDELNAGRARAHVRRRFKPLVRSDGVMVMFEFDESLPRPDALSPRYSR